MKAALFRKDNMGVAVGRLRSPNELLYEDNGSIKLFHLTGEVVDTEFNDVLILGKKTGEETLEVAKMESLPHNGEDMVAFKALGEGGPVYCLAIPIDRLKDSSERVSNNGKTYHTAHFILDKNTSMFVDAYGQYDDKPANECMVFVLMELPSTEEKVFGQNPYAMKKHVTKSCRGYQVMS